MNTSHLKVRMRQLERTILQETLIDQPTRRLAAEYLGISLRTLYYKLRQHTIALPPHHSALLRRPPDE